jgi:uncharacterized lipoprotein YmbA
VLLRKKGRLLLTATILAGLAACATDADRYYSLQPAASNGVEHTRTGKDGFDYVVSVQPVQVPAQLDRSQIVLKGRSGDVSVLNASLWASPLPEELRLAISSNLTRRLGVPDLPLSVAPESLRVWSVDIDVQRFDSVYNAESVIDMTWRIQSKTATEAASVSICRATFAKQVETGLAPLLEAHRDGLQTLSGLIAQQIVAAQLHPDTLIEPPAQVDQPGVVFRGCAQAKAS